MGGDLLQNFQKISDIDLCNSNSRSCTCPNMKCPNIITNLLTSWVSIVNCSYRKWDCRQISSLFSTWLYAATWSSSGIYYIVLFTQVNNLFLHTTTSCNNVHWLLCLSSTPYQFAIDLFLVFFFYWWHLFSTILCLPAEVAIILGILMMIADLNSISVIQLLITFVTRCVPRIFCNLF